MQNFRKPETIPVLFLIASVALFTWLAVWQLQRLEWKQGLIAQIEAGKQAPVTSFNHALKPHDAREYYYHRFMLRGKFLHEKAVHRVTRYPGMQKAYHILTPLRLQDGGRDIVLVDRGIADLSKREKLQEPSGVVTIEAMMRPPRQGNWATFDNRPEVNIWFSETPAALHAITGAASDYIFEALGERQPDIYPVPSNGTVALRNDHLGYAITWMMLIVVAIVMFVVYHITPVARASASTGSQEILRNRSRDSQDKV